ncbi:T7SS effector LXG polymorphic toxin [Fictibacillus sp. Mic-4]|uniref:ribonuclease YeeF family protein n=1 Tax=Fictibacillus sp. Mic-4 TaxID=3132826 RepID=UPI003CECD081
MANSKVYEAKTLVAAMEERAKHYKTFQEQLNDLKKAFQAVVDLGDDFKGKGADAIKDFYRAQIDVVDEWIDLTKQQIAFFNGIKASTEDVNLADGTVVHLPFLENELKRAYQTSNDLVYHQQEELKKIFNDISDIISLDVFSREPFAEHINKANKERTDTIEKVNQFDHDLKEEYSLSEPTENMVLGLYSALIEATKKDGEISPIHFSLNAYHNSKVYQLKDDVQKNTKAYLDFKEEQAEVRRLKKLEEERKNRPWYEKAWDTVCTFTGEITGYYDAKRAAEGIDPVTGRKLSAAERVAAGAMAAAGFIPVIGWAGRALKGGSAIYKTARGINAASHALDAYKATKTLDALKMTEKGIYGFIAANGMTEAATGKDMFGNQLTKEQRENSFLQALTMGALGGMSHYADKLHAKNLPYSHAYTSQKVAEAQRIMQELRRKIGQLKVPVGIRSEVLATHIGTVRHFSLDQRTLSEVKQNFARRVESNKGISSEKYKELRKKTPSKEIRKKVNPEGPKFDPVYGYEVKKFEADHIVSMKEITEMDGFDQLTKEQQIEVLNLEENFVGLGKSTNASKGAYSWSEWAGHSKLGKVPDDVRKKMLELEEHARKALKKAIEERLNK